MPDVSERKYFATWRQLPLYFGTAIYAFEGKTTADVVQNINFVEKLRFVRNNYGTTLIFWTIKIFPF
jgi:hypothetical protein